MLITKQWEEEARRALRKLRASNQVEEDIEEMRAEERAQQAESTISMGELICSPTLRAPLVIGVVMQLSQQLSGINAVSLLKTISFHCTLTITTLNILQILSNLYYTKQSSSFVILMHNELKSLSLLFYYYYITVNIYCLSFRCYFFLKGLLLLDDTVPKCWIV